MSSPTDKPAAPAAREVAPSFTLTGASGDVFSLDEQRGVRRSLLLFYPQDMTSG